MDQKSPVLDYARPIASTRKPLRRILYCVGLPLIGFGLGYGIDRKGDDVPLGCLIALGCLFVAFALPVRD
jgi:hypothetical protein